MTGDAAHHAVIRADASAAIGTGHVMRCLGLARALVGRGWQVTFLAGESPAPLRAMMLAVGRVIDLPTPEPLGGIERPLDGRAADVCITDSYAIDAPWQAAARSWARRIMAIDDLAGAPQDADLILNQNLGVDRLAYSRLTPAGAKALIGPRYAIVRPEFLAARRSRPRRDGCVRRALVFVSGADVPDVSRRAAEACVATGLEVDVVTGSAYPHRDDLAEWATRQPLVDLHENVDTMGELMARADLAIGAPSSSSWERCTVGLPAIVVTVADNQRIVEAELARLGAVVALGWHDSVTIDDLARTIRRLRDDPELVRMMARAARRIADGNGAERVVRELERLVVVDDR